jgi:hypothetical protein
LALAADPQTKDQFTMTQHRSTMAVAPRPVVAVALLASALTALAGSLQPVALTGTDGAYGPQLGPGIQFVAFATSDLDAASPALNSAGQAAFLARLIGTGISPSNDTGVWIKDAGGLRLAARTGDPAPGTDPGIVFSGFYTEPMIDAAGHTAFKAIIAGPGVDNYTNDGLWSEGSGVMSLVIRENVTPVPGGGGFFADPWNPGSPTPTVWGNNPLLMNSGKIVQRAFINPGLAPWNLYGAWTDRSGALDAFIRADQQPVPGLPGSYFFGVGNPTMNAALAMIAPTVRADPPGPDRWGVWTDRSGTLAKLLESGDPVPGMPGAVVHSVDDTCINAHGRVALLISFEDFLPPPTILSEARYGALQIIAKYGGLAPDTDGGNYYSFNTPVISDNDSGVTAFRGRLLLVPPITEATCKGIWSNSGGTLHLVARSGNPAPGLPGVTYSDFYALAINATGQVAFIAALSDGVGLFREDAAGVIGLVVRDFQLFDVFGDGSDVRLITGLATPEVSGNPYTSASTGDGRRIYFNDSGDLAFRLTFVDGSEGIFVTSSLHVGDLNCDGSVNFGDINPFVLYLSNFTAWQAAYTNCDARNGDINGDGTYPSFGDINPFVALLTGGGG